MLTPELRQEIFEVTKAHWEHAVQGDVFVGIAAGKEIGHRIADHVDDETTKLLVSRFDCAHQMKSTGAGMPRSMGDVWVKSNGIYNPINIKAGETGKNGQPNMVSLKKLLRALLARQLDSYYLLIVKGTFLSSGHTVAVYLVDLLDYLDFTVFDSGPGQIMMKEQQFYDAVARGYTPPNRSLQDKAEILYEMLVDADRRLIENRIKARRSLELALEKFPQALDRAIDQREFHLR